MEADILLAVKGLAVAPVSISSRHTEVMGARQQHAEQFRIYVWQVCKLTMDCQFLMQCNRTKASGGVCALSCCKNAVCCGKGGKQITWMKS